MAYTLTGVRGNDDDNVRKIKVQEYILTAVHIWQQKEISYHGIIMNLEKCIVSKFSCFECVNCGIRIHSDLTHHLCLIPLSFCFWVQQLQYSLYIKQILITRI